MLERVLEPEVMDTPEEAHDYDTMDHSEVNRIFAEEFLRRVDQQGDVGPEPLRVLDVGTGTARIPIQICQLRPAFRITGIDLSLHMLQLAGRNIAQAGLEDQIEVARVDAKRMPYADATFDAVISNSIIHHIPQPLECLREMVRVLRPGGVLLVRDLLRPRNAEQIATILARHAGGTKEHQWQLFKASLHAALTLEEVQEMLQAVGLPTDWVSQTSDRHWTIGSLPVSV